MLVNVRIKGQMFPYDLSGPYEFKTGKKRGTAAEKLMFLNRSYLVWLKNVLDAGMKIGSKPNKMHLHLGWILNAGEFVKASHICNYCFAEPDKKNIQFFSVRHSHGLCTYGERFTCCDGDSCKFRLLEEKSHLLPLKFSSLSYFRNGEEGRIGKFFKEIFLGREQLDPDEAFQLFLSANTASQL